MPFVFTSPHWARVPVRVHQLNYHLFHRAIIATRFINSFNSIQPMVCQNDWSCPLRSCTRLPRIIHRVRCAVRRFRWIFVDDSTETKPQESSDHRPNWCKKTCVERQRDEVMLCLRVTSGGRWSRVCCVYAQIEWNYTEFQWHHCATTTTLKCHAHRNCGRNFGVYLRWRNASGGQLSFTLNHNSHRNQQPTINLSLEFWSIRCHFNVRIASAHSK